YTFSEDMMYQDDTGLIFLDYSSVSGVIGNIFFALTKIKSLFGAPSRAVGWFYRNIGSRVSLQYLESEHETIKSRPVLWRLVWSALLVLLSIILAVFWSSLPIPDFVRALHR